MFCRGRSLLVVKNECLNICVRIIHPDYEHEHYHFNKQQYATQLVNATRLAEQKQHELIQKYGDVLKYNQYRDVVMDDKWVREMKLDAVGSQNMEAIVLFDADLPESTLQRLHSLEWKIKRINGEEVPYTDGYERSNGFTMMQFLYPARVNIHCDDPCDLRNSSIKNICINPITQAFKLRKLDKRSVIRGAHFLKKLKKWRVRYRENGGVKTKEFDDTADVYERIIQFQSQHPF